MIYIILYSTSLHCVESPRLSEKQQLLQQLKDEISNLPSENNALKKIVDQQKTKAKHLQRVAASRQGQLLNNLGKIPVNGVLRIRKIRPLKPAHISKQ